MFLRLRVVDRSRFLGVLGKIAKYVLLIPLAISIFLSPIISFFTLLENSHGDYCSDIGEGLIYHDGYECYLSLLNLPEIFIYLLVGIFIFFLKVVLSIVLLFYLIYLIYARERLGLGNVADRSP